jgi:hypothetical protein
LHLPEASHSPRPEDGVSGDERPSGAVVEASGAFWQADWAQLRFVDFKTVEAYNSAMHHVMAQLRLCGQVVTELEMIEKSLETFHPTNMVLQQQYRNNKYIKYYDLINVLLTAKAHNELLMKNFNMRPAGTQA